MKIKLDTNIEVTCVELRGKHAFVQARITTEGDKHDHFAHFDLTPSEEVLEAIVKMIEGCVQDQYGKE